MTQAMKGDFNMTAFWFKCGLKYYERCDPEHINRHLVMLGLYYATREKRMMAEGIYRQVLDKCDFGKSTQRNSYTLSMALNFYGRMLLDSNIKRKSEADDYIKQSDSIIEKLPKWHD